MMSSLGKRGRFRVGRDLSAAEVVGEREATVETALERTITSSESLRIYQSPHEPLPLLPIFSHPPSS